MNADVGQANGGLNQLLQRDAANIKRRLRDIQLVWNAVDFARTCSFEELEESLGCKFWWNHYFDSKSPSKDVLEPNTRTRLSELWHNSKIGEVLGYEIVDDFCSILTLLIESDEEAEYSDCLGKVSFVIFGDFPKKCYLAGFFDAHHYESERYHRADAINIQLSLYSKSPYSVAKIRWGKLLLLLSQQTGEKFSVEEYENSFTAEVSFLDMPRLSGKEIAMTLHPEVVLS